MLGVANKSRCGDVFGDPNKSPYGDILGLANKSPHRDILGSANKYLENPPDPIAGGSIRCSVIFSNFLVIK